ncbi:MAG: hypothetical protein NC924_10435 [Candidatus Omnitrophica bacterium]|nr:hypothetical protein [Candidatus Omnitrophota bacterium]
MNLWQLFALIVIVDALGIFLLFLVLRKKRGGTILAQFADKTVVRSCSSANFFGQQSRGCMQVRGNGELVLTADELFYEMWIPKKQLRIPRSSITNVSKVYAHLMKSCGFPLLKVEFTNADGQADAAAWLVRDLPAWMDDLKPAAGAK